MLPSKNIIFGGTFDPLHDGHRSLFERAFELGNVTIGLTSDELAHNTRPISRQILPFPDREKNLISELLPLSKIHSRTFEILELITPTSIASEGQYDVLVVSPETEPVSHLINQIRKENGLNLLSIVTIPFVHSTDGKIISSTRILSGEIDPSGNSISP